MSEHVWCHGPSCHLSHTQDRVRGVKGSKVLRTRKVQFNPQYLNMYSYFCSNSCYNDFANKHIERVIAIAPRTVALETPIDVQQVKHPEHYNGHYTQTAWTETKIVRVDNNGG
jgi:YHS domain-containing protein